MDSCWRWKQGGSCAWWADLDTDHPPGPRQKILRGYPAQGIPFPKEDDTPKCDVCRNVKPIKRAPLKGWRRYSVDHRKSAPSWKGREKHKVAQGKQGLKVMASVKPSARLKWGSYRDENQFIRHDGHYKKPEQKRVVTFVKQYQGKNRSAEFSESEEEEDVGPDYSNINTSVPVCGVNCHQVRENLYKAVDELLCKEPEVVRIKPRMWPTQFFELEQLAASLPIHEVTSAEDNEDREHISVGAEGKKTIESSTQTLTRTVVTDDLCANGRLSEPENDYATTTRNKRLVRFQDTEPIKTAKLLDAGDVFVRQDGVENPLYSPRSSHTDVTQLLYMHPFDPSTHRDSRDNLQPSITSLLFPQPRLEGPIHKVQMTPLFNSTAKLEEKFVSPENTSGISRLNSTPQHKPEFTQHTRLNKYKQDPAIDTHSMIENTSAGMHVKPPLQVVTAYRGHRPSGNVSVREASRSTDIMDKIDTSEVEVKLRLNCKLESSTLDNKIKDIEPQFSNNSQELNGVGNGKDRLEVETRGTSESRSDQWPTVSSSSRSSPELEYMKAAILSHTFYPRLVSSFIEQHAEDAPPEAMAKLEHGHRKIMQSWNPRNSEYCEGKIKKYQEFLTRFEADYEGPFREAMDFSYTLDDILSSSLPSSQRRVNYERNIDRDQVPIMLA